MVAPGTSNLARSAQGQVSPDVLFEDVCFDAQQAVEKALKALLVWRGVQVPRTHAISELITMLAELGFHVPADVQEASALTDYAVAARYPGPSAMRSRRSQISTVSGTSPEPVLVEDYEKAVAIAKIVVSWASGIVARSSEP